MHELVKACVSNPVETSQRINDDPQVETDIILVITEPELGRIEMLDEQVELLTLDHDAASAVGQEGSSEVTRGIQSCKSNYSVPSQNTKLYSSFIISLKKRTCAIFLLN